MWSHDCNDGHPEAKSSELAFRLRTKPRGPQRDETGAVLFELGDCHVCRSTIAFEGEVSHEG